MVIPLFNFSEAPLIEQYVKKFLDAQDWTEGHTDSRLNYAIKIDPSVTIDMQFVADALVKDFSEFISSTDILPGHCFVMTREVSYVLFDLGIKHVVTIGDVLLPTGLDVGMSNQSLEQELRDGYKIAYDRFGYPVGVPANAHAWITLENGQILDCTILASMNSKSGGRSLQLRDAIYYLGCSNEIIHIPFLTGFAYHYNVLTDPRDKFYQEYMQWYETYFGFLEKISTSDRLIQRDKK